MNNKLFTLAIPTYNRSEYLDICLNRILIAYSKLNNGDKDLIEILVSDNSENVLSTEVVNNKKYQILNINYVKNRINIGSDQNLANCYIKSNGVYTSLMGDDDFVEQDYFQKILPIIKKQKYSVIFLKYHGYTFSSNEKRQNTNFKNLVFKTSKDALLHRNIHISFISGVIFRRDKLNEKEINSGIGSNLVQVNACFNVLKDINKESIYISTSLVGAIRNNTGGYNPVKVFFKNYFDLLHRYDNLGLSEKQLRKLKNKILLTFYSRNLAQYIRKNNIGLSKEDFEILDQSFKRNVFYKLFIRKMLQSYSRINFSLLSIIYIISNIFYYPSKFFDFLKHTSNMIKHFFIQKNL
ncbi:glycosyltransferase [Gammaproteobacteria bacterium]|nr:glycosyltransferase [Gammaproteobacteria bacterium]MDC0401927.1 glycosyltransferase [Gammaproteobacteria bacterium]